MLLNSCGGAVLPRFKIGFFRLAILAFLVSFPFGQIAQSEDASNTTNAPVLPAYKDLPVRTGLWNDGQAALWDLRIFDHYMVFGPESRTWSYKPEQPIAFSHVTHVQKNRMECQYCHWSVTKSSYAALPEVEACIGCHKLVNGVLNVRADTAEKDPAKSEAEKKQLRKNADEAAKIQGYFDRGEPIPWIKVHVMPEHVNFNHKRHVKAGVACHECHGIIPNMPVVQRVTPMKMGWCIDCHRDKGTSIDCWTCHK